jgi:hypothetical protein
MDKTEIIKNVCYSELVYGRINKKLKKQFSNKEIEEMIYNTLTETRESEYQKKGKNFYVINYERKIRVTINSNTYKVITVDSIVKNLF